jgi:YVTN family beta-propeller protein
VVYVVDTTTNANTATIPINNAFQVMVSRDGTKAYVVGGRGGSSTFSIVDTATNTVTETTPLSGWVDNSTALSADGSTAYLVCQSLKNAKAGAVYVINTATGALTHTITVGDYPQQIALVQ